jgi:hypothetical protein
MFKETPPCFLSEDVYRASLQNTDSIVSTMDKELAYVQRKFSLSSLFKKSRLEDQQ